MKHRIVNVMCLLAAAGVGWIAAQHSSGADPGSRDPRSGVVRRAERAAGPQECPYLWENPNENEGQACPYLQQDTAPTPPDAGTSPPESRGFCPGLMGQQKPAVSTVVELGAAASDPARFVSELEGNEPWNEQWQEEDPDPDLDGPDGLEPEIPEGPPVEVDFFLISWLGRDEHGEPVSGTILVQVTAESGLQDSGRS